MVAWTYQGSVVPEEPPAAYGFTYKITYVDGSYYYGKKSFYETIKKPPLKGYKRKRVITRENKWRDYTGSNDVDLEIKSREILKMAGGKQHLSYLEYELLFETKSMFDDMCHNANIGGKFFKGNIDRVVGDWTKLFTKEDEC